MELTFGKHKGKEVKDCPVGYLSWLVNPKLKGGETYSVPKSIKLEAEHYLDAYQYILERLSGKTSGKTEYVVERLGDITGLSLHDNLEQALVQIESECPMDDGERIAPDPEDDRILVWEVLPGGHKKVVWHFSGWHWDSSEFYELEQGSLPSDPRNLYSMTNP